MTSMIDVQFIFDTSLTGDIQAKINYAIAYGKRVFINNDMPFALNQVFEDRKISYDFSQYKTGTPPQSGAALLLADMADPQTPLGRLAAALLVSTPPKQVIVAIVDGLFNSGMGESYGTGTVNEPFLTVTTAIGSDMGRWVLVHEIAHIFGATHCASVGGPASNEPPCTEKLFSLGNRRTVMSKNFDLDLLDYFSDQNLRFEGQRLGDSQHDNAGTLNTNIPPWLAAKVSKTPSFGPIAATQFKIDEIEISSIGSDGNVYDRVRRAANWKEYQGLVPPSQVDLQSLAIVTPSFGVSSTRIYALGPNSPDSTLYELIWEDGKLGSWAQKGDPGPTRCPPYTSIGAVAWTVNNFCLYVTASDGMVWERKWANGWNDDWYSINRPPGVKLTDIAAVCPNWGTSKYGIYGVGDDGFIWERKWLGNYWTEAWYNLNKPGGVNFVAVAATAVDLDVANPRFALYGTGDDGNVYEHWFHDKEWDPWASLGSPAGVKLTSIAAASLRLDYRVIYAAGDDGNLYERECKPLGWSAWQPI